MYKVVVECPSTNKAIYTGLTLNEADFPNLLNIARQVHCPYCEGSHVWFRHDAILLDEEQFAKQVFHKEHPREAWSRARHPCNL